MVIPDFATFQEMARQGNLIPVYREILGDLETPVAAYKKLRGQGCSFLLESVEGGEKWGRFSFLGLNPSLTFQVKGDKVTIQRRGKRKPWTRGPIPLPTCAACWPGFRRCPRRGCPGSGGGWWATWATTWCASSRGCRSITPAIDLPEARLLLADNLLIFDNLRQTIKVVALVHLDPDVP